MARLNKELTYLDIFYSDLSYVDIQTTSAYDFLTLVCDVGGALGLIIGGTLLTIRKRQNIESTIHVIYLKN